MKRIYTLFFMILFLASSIVAQDVRYVDDLFEDVSVTSNVVYGVNATVLAVPVFGEAIPQPLTMDVYEPVGDTETERPVVLVFHTGNFLPNVTNGQIAGTKEDNSSQEICRQLARKGYVAASVTYRGGWNPLADTQPIRALGLIQAAYRGIQDGRNAIRYFRQDAIDGDNMFGIDPTRITAWGNGTGGYLTLGLATLDDYLEIVQTQNGPGKFLLDLNGDGAPETPMVVPAYHGDINGDSLTIAPDAAFGLPAGDTTNMPNHVGYSSEVNLVVNIGGALGDKSWIDENTAPIITVQSANDIFAPYEDAVLIVPTTGDDIVRVQGGLEIAKTLDGEGLLDIYSMATFDDATTDKAKANSAAAGHDYYPNLFPVVNPPNSSGLDEGTVIDWWDPNALSPPILPDFPNGVPWNMLPHPSGGTFHTQGLLLNENMSEETAVANITEYMSFILPRACIALDLPCRTEYEATDSNNDIVLDPSIMTIAPNPATTNIKITAEGELIKHIAIFGTDGKEYTRINDIDQESYTIIRNNLPTGIYFVKAFFEEGIATQRVVFK